MTINKNFVIIRKELEEFGGLFLMLFITGLTGHTGRFFHQKLVEEGYKGKIRYVTRDASNQMFKDSPLNLEKIVGDIADLDFLKENMRGVNTVLHIASIMTSEKVIEAAISNKVKWTICVHTTGRFSKYKSASEGYIRIEDGILKRRNEIDITIVRPTMIYGTSADRNMYKLVDYLNRHKIFPMFGSGKNLMQPVHARDLGNAYYEILIRPEITSNREYDLSGKYAEPYLDIVQTVSKTLNKNNAIVKLPIWFSISAAKIYNALYKNALINAEQVMRMQEDKAFSYELASKDFGYNPISFKEGIIGEVEEYLQSK
jgi:nucleoside-diphosphate-sugar epimerase